MNIQKEQYAKMDHQKPLGQPMNRNLINSINLNETHDKNRSIFTSSVHLTRNKTVTIPSFDSNSFYVIENDESKEESSISFKRNNIDHMIMNKRSFPFDPYGVAHNHNEQEQINEEPLKDYKRICNEESDNEAKLIELNQKLTVIKEEKIELEGQLNLLQKEKSLLIEKHEQQVQYLNEQIELYQVNCIFKAGAINLIYNLFYTKKGDKLKVLHENNELKINQTKNNTELTRSMFVNVEWSGSCIKI